MDQQRLENPGNFTVPPGASMLTQARFAIAPDMAADAIVRIASTFRLQGNGLSSTHKPFFFVGPCGGSWQTTDGMHASKSIPAIYNLGIPVIPGQEIEGAFRMVGEDPGDMQGILTLIYDGPQATPAIVAADVREGDLADAAEALVLINTDLEGTSSNFLVPAVSSIAAIAYAVGMDVALVTRFAHHFEVDGDGLNLPIKPQRWGGWAGFQELDTAGGETEIDPPEMIFPNFPVTAGLRITARAGMIEDDYGAGTALVGLLYV